MFDWRRKYLQIVMRRNEDFETPYHFVERVLTVSLPTAIMLIILVIMGEVSPVSAVAGFAGVVVLTVLLSLPFFVTLQSVTRYVREMADEKDFSELPHIAGTDDESALIIAAINRMRTIWLNKTERLEAQTLSDAAVLDSLPDPLLMLDEDGEVMGANMAAREILGVSVREKKLADVIRDNALEAAAEHVISAEEPKRSLEITLNGRTYNAKIERLPAEAKAGAVAVLTLFDMTAQKQFEQMQADFVANASHELRTPLSILSGFVETLQGTARDDAESRDKFLGIMQTQAVRMSALIESLLSLSRLQMNANNKPSDAVNVPEILKNVKQMLDSKAEKKNAVIALKLCTQPYRIFGDAGELTQVFQNLTDNALKYGQDGGTVTLSCKVDGNNYLVSVHNTGDTIKPEALPHVFERFYRVAETKNKARGTGLGLAIVAQIVKHHDGKITVESSAELGTTFTVSLPFSPEVGGSEDTESQAPADTETP